MKAFVEVLHDREKGRHYRFYAGINPSHLPCEATFANLKQKLEEEPYNQIFHVLVEIAEPLGFLSYKIIATDGTLFPTNARYKACPPPARSCLAVAGGSLSLRRVSDSPEFRCPHFSESRNPEAGLRKSETGTRKRAGRMSRAGRHIFITMGFIGYCVFFDQPEP